MKNKMIYLLGAGGFSRELYSYLERTDFTYNGYVFGGFLDDNEYALEGYDISHVVKGKLKSEDLNNEDVILLMGVANCRLKNQLYDFYKALKFEFLTYIHPSVILGHNVDLGEGCVLAPNAVVTTNVSIGKLCTLNANSTVGHDATIGDFCTLSGHCDVTGFVTLDNRVFMGSHSLVIPSTIVGADVVIGAGSVIISKVKSGTTMFGNPAKKIK
ncbi:acetyltransferase [Shewanella yunxiaonensis]|uniref:Acetyltransferase n=1 Tax=Shewanella yunxiaonensis TaxID=2829809 RepID=A0ABX7YW09_9GAMM|nr:acetyltransferase [Shewanella yunxiaonensis]